MHFYSMFLVLRLWVVPLLAEEMQFSEIGSVHFVSCQEFAVLRLLLHMVIDGSNTYPTSRLKRVESV